MKAVLIGATGLVGAAVLNELERRGDTVTAIARKTEAIEGTDKVTPTSIDISDTAALSEVLKGHDVVISAYNPGWDNPNYYEDFLKGQKSIQQAAKDAGVSRFIVVGGAGSLYVNGTQLVDQPEFPEEYREGAKAARDYLSFLTEEETDLDWVFLSPPVEFNVTSPKQRKGTYRTQKDSPVFDEEGHSNISPADLALALVDEAATPKHHKERFTVGY